MAHALVVEDDPDAAKMIATLVGSIGMSTSTACSLGDARRVIAMRRPDLVLLDLYLPDGNGLQLLEEGAGLGSHIEVVLMTGQASLDSSIEALRLGAADYLVKPVDRQRLQSVLLRIMGVAAAASTPTGRHGAGFGALIGRSAPMQAAFAQIERVASTSMAVFITGESGTGKELAARSVHDNSHRARQPFLALNCGALSPQLVESEIFGHERGSFTGADKQHIGFFESADGGTLFLDEVTEMPAALQAKLLRVLETGSFMRVGSTQLRHTDVRIVAASNRDPARAVAGGDLREDLFWRLSAFPLHLPPLRERPDDVLLLAGHFLSALSAQEGRTKRLATDAQAHLLRHAWPGNVRELRNVLQRAWVMAAGDEIDASWLPALPAAPEADRATGPGLGAGLHVALGESLADIERRVVLATYEHCGRQRERTAAVLGVSMRTLYSRLKAYGV